VHWFYIVAIVSFFAHFALALLTISWGKPTLGRFLSALWQGFWLLRIGLQWLYYDYSLLRQTSGAYLVYTAALIVLVVIFGTVAMYPRA